MSRSAWDLPDAIAAHLAPGTVTEDADPPCVCGGGPAVVETWAGPLCQDCLDFANQIPPHVPLTPDE